MKNAMTPSEERRSRANVPLTYDWLHEAGLRYLDRYNATASKLRQVLTRRLRTAALKLPEEQRPDSETEADWIRQVIERFTAVGLVDDLRFSEGMASSLRRRGLGKRAIENRLRARGVAQQVVCDALDRVDEGQLDCELTAARRLVVRRKLGYLRSEERRADCVKRDLAALARAGFAYDVANRALREPESQT